MKTNKYLRKASRNFLCECCNKQINKGEEYIDFETVSYHSNNSITFFHRRIHKQCDKTKVKYFKTDLPMVVSYLADKERLVGKVFYVDKWYLLTQDWMTNKYYKRTFVRDCNGYIIKPEDVEL